MKIVIDGYNVLKQIYKTTYISEADRYRFLQSLAAYANKKNHTILILFDGGPSAWALQEKVSKKVRSCYVGTGKSADDYIKSIIEDAESKSLLIVTDDAQISSYAQRHDIVSIHVSAFYACMQEALVPFQEHGRTTVVQGPVTKLSSTSSPEIDQLMESLSQSTYTKPDDQVLERQPKAHRGSGQETRLRHILKKL